MKEITLLSLDSIQYQPNIVIAILLALYSSHTHTWVIRKSMLGTNEPYFNKFIDTLIDNVKIKNLYPLIDKIEDKDTITLKIDGFRYDQSVQREIQYTKYFSDMFKKYCNYFKEDWLENSEKNMPSWKTLSSDFINSIDTTCNLNDYKIFTLKYIQVIAYYVIYEGLYINYFKIEPNLEEGSNIIEDSSWKIRISLSVKYFISYIQRKEKEAQEIKSRKKLNYSARELKLIYYVKQSMEYKGCRISPEEILEAISPDGDMSSVNTTNRYKFVSNFVSKLNKKYLHNTGRKLFSAKEFKDCYWVPYYREENEEF